MTRKKHQHSQRRLTFDFNNPAINDIHVDPDRSPRILNFNVEELPFPSISNLNGKPVTKWQHTDDISVPSTPLPLSPMISPFSVGPISLSKNMGDTAVVSSPRNAPQQTGTNKAPDPSNWQTNSVPATEVKHLHLYDMQIQSMKDIHNLHHAKNIEELNLHLNNISKITHLNFSNLRILNLSANSITEISGLSHLPKLEELDLSSNQLVTIPPGSLRKCTLLKKLTLSYNNIRRIPGLSGENFQTIKPCLIHLDLRGNSITHLDELKVLDHLSASLQHVLFQNSKLERGNPICSDPKYYENIAVACPGLESLDGIRFNAAEYIPKIRVLPSQPQDGSDLPSSSPPSEANTAASQQVGQRSNRNPSKLPKRKPSNFRTTPRIDSVLRSFYRRTLRENFLNPQEQEHHSTKQPASETEDVRKHEIRIKDLENKLLQIQKSSQLQMISTGRQQGNHDGLSRESKTCQTEHQELGMASHNIGMVNQSTQGPWNMLMPSPKSSLRPGNSSRQYQSKECQTEFPATNSQFSKVEFEEKLKSVQVKLRQVEDALASERTRCNLLTEKDMQVQSENATMRALMAELKLGKANLEAQLNTKGSELLEQGMKLKTLERALRETKAQSDEKACKLLRDLTDANEALAKARAEISVAEKSSVVASDHASQSQKLHVDRIRYLEKKVGCLEAELAKQQGLVSSLKEESKQIKDRHHCASQIWDQKRRHLEEMAENHEQEKVKLKELFDVQLAERGAAIEGLKKEFHNVEQNCQDSLRDEARRYASLREKLEKSNQALGKLKRDNSDLQKMTQEIVKSERLQKNSLLKAGLIIKQQKRVLCDLRAEIADSSKTVEKLGKEKTELESKLESAVVGLDSASAKVKTLERAVKALQCEKAELTTRAVKSDELQKLSLESLETKNTEEIRALQASLKGAKNELTKVQDELAIKNQVLDSQNDDLKQLKDKLCDLDQQNANLMKELERLVKREHEFEKSEEKIEDLEEQRQGLEEDLKCKREKYEKEVDRLKEGLSYSLEEVQNLRDELQKGQERIKEEHRLVLAEMQETLASKEKSLSVKKVEVEELSKQLEEVNLSLEDSKEEAAKIFREHAVVSKALTAREKEIRVLIVQLESQRRAVHGFVKLFNRKR